MPRPRKSRRICARPHCTMFVPHNGCGRHIIMSLGEYEVIRLIDWEGLNQMQCAEQMGIARTTAQAIYAQARKKLADCIVNGHSLNITGGDVHLCEHRSGNCGQGCCRREADNLHCGMDGRNGLDGMDEMDDLASRIEEREEK